MRIGKTRPGTIVLVDALFSEGGGSKVRPALVLARFGEDLIVAAVTSNLDRVRRLRTQLVIDPAECETSGLKHRSVVRCERLMTVATNRVIKQVGYVNRRILDVAKQCLKAAFRLS